MSDRLAELRRQRSLVQEHLAWLDREVAALEKGALSSGSPTQRDSGPGPFIVGVNTVAGGGPSRASSPPPPSAPTVTSAVPPLPAVAPGGAVAPDTILEEYRVPPARLKKDVRSGCLLYFAAAFGLLIVLVGILYFALSSR